VVEGRCEKEFLTRWGIGKRRGSKRKRAPDVGLPGEGGWKGKRETSRRLACEKKFRGAVEGTVIKGVKGTNIIG